MKWVYSLAFVACIVAANAALSAFGTVPVGFGLMAPAGVFFAGATFGFRDAAQETGGRLWTVGLIAVGALLSAVIDPTFALASGAAFAVSELADFAVYTPLRNRNWPTAVVLSNLVGSILDSAIFLTIAFGSLDFMAGQVVGKTYMTALALPIVGLARRKRATR
jgi:uncharacterized PurR-regulated membrane protein YhhQ (DUF165 family)